MKYKISLNKVTNLLLATSTSQVISIASTIALARIYNPQVFGGFALFSSVAVLLNLLTTLRIEALIPAQSSNRRSYALFLISCFSVSATSIAILLLLSIIQRFIDLNFNVNLLIIFIFTNGINISSYY